MRSIDPTNRAFGVGRGAGLLAAILFAGVLAPLAARDSLTEAYREPASRILGAALADDRGWEKLAYLTTQIGHRLSGSSSLEEAIDWAAEAMEAEGLVVRKEPVMVPHWVRGAESLAVTSPRPRPLPMLGLGNSVGTPEGGIEAEVIVVRSFEELDDLGEESVRGKIVVYAVDWNGYGGTVRYRSTGASRAARYGAVAALVRSATGNSLATPHTGALSYSEGLEIPAAAITVEDALWFRRMAEAGETVRVRLDMEAEMLPDAQSYNLIAEIPGTEVPEEVVVMGGHYDSWDVGQGAHDDGAACVAAWHVLTLIHEMGLRPRRTLRVVLWTNEENGLRGGQAYRESVGDAVQQHVAAIEMDGGNERPVGIGATVSADDAQKEKAYEMLEQIGALLEGIEAEQVSRAGGGADIGPLMRSGVPGIGLRTVGEHYFDWHHTDADTLDKIEPNDFRRAMAVLGVYGYVLADMPETLNGR